MRSFIAILLASAFLLQSASKLMIVVNYQVNKEYIAKNLCENKAKPKMHCNGKCHLKKQLEKQEKKENSPSNNLKEKFEVQFFSEKKIMINTTVSEKNKIAVDYLFGNYNKHLLSVFHPPQA